MFDFSCLIKNCDEDVFIKIYNFELKNFRIAKHLDCNLQYEKNRKNNL